MNITEATAWNKVVNSLKDGATDEERAAGLEAAALLAVRSYTALHAGPSSDVVTSTIQGAQVCGTDPVCVRRRAYRLRLEGNL